MIKLLSLYNSVNDDLKSVQIVNWALGPFKIEKMSYWLIFKVLNYELFYLNAINKAHFCSFDLINKSDKIISLRIILTENINAITILILNSLIGCIRTLSP